MLRNILGIRPLDKISNARVFKQSGSPSVIYKIIKQEFEYAGHLAREGKDKWHKLATEWTPYGSNRSKGLSLIHISEPTRPY